MPGSAGGGLVGEGRMAGCAGRDLRRSQGMMEERGGTAVVRAEAGCSRSAEAVVACVGSVACVGDWGD